MSDSKYDWRVGQVPPLLDRHSLAKHKVLRDYLKLYVAVLTRNPSVERLRLTLVDGFCGGGIYRGPKDERMEGSPLIMLHAMAEAETIAKGSRTKPFQLDTQFHFIDENKAACIHLEHVLRQTGHPEGRVHVWNGKFQERVPGLITSIKDRGRAGRCIFVLDQYGYMNAPMRTLRTIFNELPRAEVVLTFATDALIDYLGKNEASQRRLDNLGFDLSVEGLMTAKETEPLAWRRIVQRELHQEIHRRSGAKHYTPFFIRCPEAHRSYWLVHLSNHSRARDVMTSLHWAHGNDFIHYGGSGLQMLGHDWRQEPGEENEPLLGGEFSFDQAASQCTKISLLSDLPKRLPGRRDEPVEFARFFSETTNETPATSDIMRDAMSELSREGEIEVFSKDGNLRTPGAKIDSTDRLRIALQTRCFI
jgi:three-Cys-motif partner protein